MFGRTLCALWTNKLRNVFRDTRTECRKPRRLSLENLEKRDVPTAGLLDTTFGTVGKTVIPFDLAPPNNVTDQARAFAVQSDNKIVIVGGAQTATGDQDFAITRLNADGTLDTTFGNGGKQTVSFNPNQNEYAQAVVVQADGKIVVAGTIQLSAADSNFGVTRLNADGSLDTTFGVNGRSDVAFDLNPVVNNDIARGVALQADGKIVVVGSALDGSLRNEIALDRLNADGTLDTTFGAGGKTTLGFTEDMGPGGKVLDCTANAVTIQADGKIVVAGSAIPSPSITRFAVVRYDSTGKLDPSFGNGGPGQLALDFPPYGMNAIDDEANAVAVQADGKIVVAGQATTAPGEQSFAVARVNTNGTDTTFGTNGKVTVPFTGGVEICNGVAVQPDGKILLGGQVITGLNTDFGAARLNTDGTLDTTFGTGGKATVSFASVPHADSASGVALQSDGRIILAGTVRNAGTANQDFAATRLTGDTMTPTTPTGGTGTPPKTLNFDKLGAYRPSDGSFSLDTNGNRAYDPGVDAVYTGYAPAGAIPVAGNWNDSPDGRDKIGYFLNGVWHLDVNGDGKDDAGDLTFKFGDAGDTPVVGKWDGVHTHVGVFTTRGTFTGFILDTTGSHDLATSESHVFGLPGDKVVVGDWTGDGKTKIGVFRANSDGSGSALFSLDLNGNYNYDGPQEAFVYGLATDGFVVGDWNGDGKSKLGVYRSSPINPGVAYFTLDSNGDRNYEAGVDEVFEFGLASDRYIAGNWTPTMMKAPGAPDMAFMGDLSTMGMMM